MELRRRLKRILVQELGDEVRCDSGQRLERHHLFLGVRRFDELLLERLEESLQHLFAFFFGEDGPQRELLGRFGHANHRLVEV